MKSRKGLTLVEMVVVIGVIVVLMGIGLLAYSHLERSTTARATRAQLQIAQALLDEYNSGPGLAQLGMSDALAVQNTNGVLSAGDAFPYKGGYYTGSGYTNLKSPSPIGIDSSPLVSAGSVDPSSSDRYPTPSSGTNPPTYPYPPPSPQTLTNAIYNTAVVTMFLSRVPVIKDSVAKVPTNSLLTDSAGNPITFTSGQSAMPTGQNLTGPVLLDGWHNPIIFVPMGGLVTRIKTGQLDANKKPVLVEVLVRSSGVINPYVPGTVYPLKATDRPFWASAGPDADFSLGDDNVYSFEH